MISDIIFQEMTCNMFLVKPIMREMTDIPRKNKDIEVFNQFGPSLVDLCCIFNFHILNGRLHDDSDGIYTCTANDGASVVDYSMASSELFNVENRDESVHFPLHCHFKFRSISPDIHSQEDTSLDIESQVADSLERGP